MADVGMFVLVVNAAEKLEHTRLIPGGNISEESLNTRKTKNASARLFAETVFLWRQAEMFVECLAQLLVACESGAAEYVFDGRIRFA